MKTLIVDSNYLAYAARFSIPDLAFKDFPTGVVFGFLKRVLALAKLHQTNKFIFCWDSRHSFRKHAYPGYKSARAKKRKQRTLEEKEIDKLAYAQFKVLRTTILPEIGFGNVLHERGLESDDLMARVVKDYWEEFRNEMLLVTTDSDLYQMLPLCSIWDPGKKELVTSQTFFADKGIHATSWVYVKAIAGCPTDNVEGVEGVAEKTAIAFLKDQLKIKSKRYRSIVSKEGRQIADRNMSLVKLPHEKTPKQELKEDHFSIKNFTRICRQWGLNSFRTPEGMEEWKKHILCREDGQEESSGLSRSVRKIVKKSRRRPSRRIGSTITPSRRN